jgi:hypothetical protein
MNNLYSNIALDYYHMKGISYSCGGRIPYKKAQSARNAAIKLNRLYREMSEGLEAFEYLEAYDCPFCTFFHIGIGLSELRMKTELLVYNYWQNIATDNIAHNELHQEIAR